MAPPTINGAARELAIHINLDFGTTRSAVVYSYSSQPEKLEAILEWPGVDGDIQAATEPKIPTELAYVDGKPVWGCQIPTSARRHQCFKLGLCPDQRQHTSFLELNYPDDRALPLIHGQSDMALATDYMRCIKEHTISILETKLGKGVVRTTPRIWSVTVPAIWSDGGKKNTQTCARAAGMGNNVRTISEPEAAAIYCILDMKDALTLKVGDKFVVCDAGGGTVDIITFEVESTDGEMVKLKEAVAGDGHACGSVFLNRRFKKWLIANYQDHLGWESDTLEDAMEHFEQDIKRNFRKGRDKNIVRVTGLSDDPNKGIRRQKLSVPSDVMQTFFEPVISTITALVCAQLKAAKGATAVLLVGGFGQSYYLEESIRDVIGEDVALWKPRKGEEAVARGGLQISMAESKSETPKLQITSRIARKSYGIALGCQFTRSDPSSKRYWCAFDGEWTILKMNWAVEKGTRVTESEPVTLNFMTPTQSYENLRRYSIDIMASSGAEPAPIYPHQGTHKLAILSADLSTIPRSEIPRSQGKDGKTWYKVNFEVRVTFYAASTKYELWYKGRCYGAVDAEYA